MDKSKLEQLFSSERLKPCYKRFPDNGTKAVLLYKTNIKISEAFYPSLSILEIVLRNAIYNSCKKHFKDEHWFKNNLPPELVQQVANIELKTSHTKKNPTPDRIVSELTFGFWTTLFNRKYAKLLWKPLHKIFLHTPRNLRKRAEISLRLNHIRILRNRIYHYEPISWNFQILNSNYKMIIELLNWLNIEIVDWTNDIDRFEIVLNKAKKELK